MHLDVVDLIGFYQTPLGRHVAAEIGRALAALCAPGSGDRVAGYGFATPYLEALRGRAERVVALMPAPQGVVAWPEEGRGLVALVEEARLPLPDQSLDTLLLVHALEMSADAPALADEARRVLAPTGRLVVVVPNRQGPWAGADVSPFGFGRPYSRGQVRQALGSAGFEVEDWTTALHAPPVLRHVGLRSITAAERLGRACWPAFAGVLVCAASPRARDPAAIVLKPAPAFKLRPALQPRPGLAGCAAGPRLRRAAARGG